MSFYGTRSYGYGYGALPGQGGGELASLVYDDAGLQAAISAAQAIQGNELTQVINNPLGEALRARVLVLEQNILAVQARVAGVKAMQNPPYPPNVFDADHRNQWDSKYQPETDAQNAGMAARLASDLASSYNDYVSGVRAAIADLHKAIDAHAAQLAKKQADQAAANELQSLRATNAAAQSIVEHGSAAATADGGGLLSSLLPSGSSGSALKPVLIGLAVIVPVGLIAFAMSRRRAAPVAGYRRRSRR